MKVPEEGKITMPAIAAMVNNPPPINEILRPSMSARYPMGTAAMSAVRLLVVTRLPTNASS